MTVKERGVTNTERWIVPQGSQKLQSRTRRKNSRFGYREDSTVPANKEIRIDLVRRPSQVLAARRISVSRKMTDDTNLSLYQWCSTQKDNSVSYSNTDSIRDVIARKLKNLLDSRSGSSSRQGSYEAHTSIRSRQQDSDILVEVKFKELADEWRKATRHMSLASNMIMHPAYQKIIGLGPSAVPLILRELKNNVDHWFWALYVITGEDPVSPGDEGRIKKMAEAWLEWGRRNGYQC